MYLLGDGSTIIGHYIIAQGVRMGVSDVAFRVSGRAGCVASNLTQMGRFKRLECVGT